ncbi:uncharacterized protein HMPREF1541_04914 [Cyphellophora europaea CBS 101466]|uniref:Cytochrome P450 n=1 Tax=Cyphellophora europaea (strain CBS 101466) TaxID=1220924 RepID=W2RWE0_CYPE1|nr:uncharacterized protein HMPREF1541_04914 [Cyphellophora europaea CBS 101466]ETN40635.1 hypothetical protein HMPREF1541_04914 [Cyphellophora europaea CBS 101466]
MMWRAVAALLCASIVYGLIQVRRKRAELAGCPQPPVMHWLLGSIPIVAKAMPLFPEDTHFHVIVNYIQQKYNMPSVWYLDLWPVGDRFVLTNDPVIASQYATTGQSLPKASAATNYLNVFLGKDSLLTSEGQHWKSLRAMYNPGFSATHLMTLVPYMVDSTLIYVDILRAKARANELFQLEEISTRLTIDIIGKVVLDTDLNSQQQDHPLVTAFRERASFMHNSARTFSILNNLEFRRLWRLHQNTKTLDHLVGVEVDRALAKRKQSNQTASQKSFKDRRRSAVDLALDGYAQEKLTNRASGTSIKPSAGEADATFRTEAITAVKTFLFAGHDTTSSTIAYGLYLLHHHPTVRSKLITELHAVYGADLSPATLAPLIKSDPYTINSLPYLTAILKETLRLFPPASTLRQTSNPEHTIPNPSPKGSPWQQRAQLPLANTAFWPIALLIHRNEEYFPRPTSFIPERFLPEQSPFPFPQSKLFTPEGKDAFRAFEKGPRTCIGEQLALIETKVILAIVVGAELGFRAEVWGREARGTGGESTLVGAEEMEGRLRRKEVGAREGRGRVVEGFEIYQILRGAGKPAYGMPGRMYFMEEVENRG